MSSSTSELKAGEEKSDRAVLCSKCERLNSRGRNECNRCGAKLYIACNDCGHKNERVRTRCNNCNRRLHYTAFEKFGRKLRGGTQRVNGVQFAVFCVGMVVAFLIILIFAKLDLRHLF